MNSAKLNSYNTQKLLLVVSITLLVLKLAAYYLTGSVAVLTDALESIVNVIAFGIVRKSPNSMTRIPKKMGLRESLNNPVWISSVFISSSIPMRHDFCM